MLKKEWSSIWKDKKYFLSILVMFVMPLLYCGLLLYAFWDPYGQLEDLPVAIVNEEQGAIYEEEQLALGDELVANLLDSPNFNFIEMTRSEADEKLLDGDVYLSIAIPAQFSQHATTMLETNPEKLEIEYKVNEAANYLSSKIGDSAINQIRSEVNEKISKTYAEQLFEAITKLGDGFGEAADGAVKIKDGVVELKSGSQELQDYLYQLASSTVTLKNGTTTLADGVSSAKKGAQQLVVGTEQLGAGSEQLANGALELQQGVNNLATGITSYTAGVSEIASNQQLLLEGQQTFQSKLTEISSASSQLATGATTVATGSEQLATAIAQLNSQLETVLVSLPTEQKTALEASLAQLVERSKQLATGAQSVQQGTANLSGGAEQLVTGHATIVDNSEKLVAGMTTLTTQSPLLESGTSQLETGFSTLASKLTTFNTGINEVVSGIKTLNDGLVELDEGSKQLAEGTETLNEKSIELAEGTTSLVEGTEKLADGTDELVNALHDAHAESAIDVTTKNYEMVSSPVDVNKNIENEVENYGTGLAPYFISLGLFVGALLITNVYHFVIPASQPTSAIRWFLSKSSVPFIIWIFQTLILTLVLLYGLKLNVTSVPLFVLLMAVSSFAYIAIVQLLIVLFDDVGKLIALIFLIIQLSSSAGTFPVELLPKVFQSLYDYMPMSYTVEALRYVISSTHYDIVKGNILTLAIIGIVCVILSIIMFKILFTRRYKKALEA